MCRPMWDARAVRLHRNCAANLLYDDSIWVRARQRVARDTTGNKFQIPLIEWSEFSDVTEQADSSSFFFQAQDSQGSNMYLGN